MEHFGIGDTLPETAERFRKKTVVRMVRMDEPFTCDSREGHHLQGQAGDYLAEDGHGGFYPISAEFHAEHYEPAPPPEEASCES